MVRTLIVLFSMVLGTAVAYGQAVPAKANPQGQSTASTVVEEEAVPEAMRHLVKGPDVDMETLRDPFASYLALVARRGRQALTERQSRLASRSREPLESFDLSTLNLVAIMHMGKDRIAMIEDKTGKGYIIRRGNYMGKNNGRIEKITDDSVFLVEQVLNPAGDVVDRQVTLTLKEVNQ